LSNKCIEVSAIERTPSIRRAAHVREICRGSDHGCSLPRNVDFASVSLTRHPLLLFAVVALVACSRSGEPAQDSAADDSADGAQPRADTDDPQPAGEPRLYGDWSAEFVPDQAAGENIDKWAAMTFDAGDGKTVLAYFCVIEQRSCGFALSRPETPCATDASDAALVSLLFAQDDEKYRAAEAQAACENGVWILDSTDAILDEIRADPVSVNISVRGDAWDFSLDGALGAIQYSEKAATADAAGRGVPDPLPQR
jgi:hypothetical protein